MFDRGPACQEALDSVIGHRVLDHALNDLIGDRGDITSYTSHLDDMVRGPDGG